MAGPEQNFNNFENAQNAVLLPLLREVVVSLNNLNQTLATLFPTADASIVGAAGAATGDYLVITVNGTSYKLALLAMS